MFLFDIVDDIEEYTSDEQIRLKIIDPMFYDQKDSIKQLIPSARTAIRKVTGELKTYFSDLAENIRTKLADHGLTGENLKIKLAIVYKIRRELWKSIKDFQNNDVVEKIINLSHKFFDAADSVLDSLADVFSGLKAVKEIKELVKSILRIRHQKSTEETSSESDNQIRGHEKNEEKI